MDSEKRAKRQSLRIIITEAIMVVSVILMVAILALLVSGYWLNSDFEVERQGMLQISSVPTGASVAVDGDAPWYQRTNTSKVLSSGEHAITLTRDGYDTWSKTINIREGLLYRIHYPRLFLNERTPEAVYDLSTVIFSTVSPDRTKLLTLTSSFEWSLVDLAADKVTAKPLQLASVVPQSSTILSADWDLSGSHILMKIDRGGATEWILIDVNTPASSINLTHEFAATDFADVEIMDHSATTLLVTRSGNLHKINVPARQISAILVKNIQSYDHLGNEIVYSALSSSTSGYEVGTFDIGNPNPKVLLNVPASSEVLLSRFYDDKYLTLVTGSSVTTYKKDDLTEVFADQLSFVPQKSKVGHSGEFITMLRDSSVATLDMESLAVREWSLDSQTYNWLDNDMLYAIKDGILVVYDFDGLNRRELATGVSTKTPVAITNDRWLYYGANDALIREVIAQ